MGIMAYTMDVADIAGVLIGVLSVVLLDYVRPLLFALYGEV